jgi:hypothetical protein
MKAMTHPEPTDLSAAGAPFITLEGALSYARSRASVTEHRHRVALRTVYNTPGGYPHRRWIVWDAEVCACTPTPERFRLVYYGITEPGSAWEWNPDCPVHRPNPNPEPVPLNAWNPVDATVSCDWCGECAWCLTYPSGQ